MPSSACKKKAYAASARGLGQIVGIVGATVDQVVLVEGQGELVYFGDADRDRTCFLLFFFFNDTATTEIYTLSLHDALPILANGPETAHGFFVVPKVVE